MAKGNINGIIRRKIGNMVGFSNKLATGKDKQIWRAYNGVVKNPKTSKQCAQRSLFVAAKNFAVNLRGILDHSWQGIDYGQKSLNHFRKLVLANGGNNYPEFFYQAKNEQRLIPQGWPISTGSLAFNTKCNPSWEDNMAELLGIIQGGDECETAQQFYDSFMSANPLLKEGDQITLVMIVADNSSQDWAKNNYIALVDRVILRPENFAEEDVLSTENGTFVVHINNAGTTVQASFSANRLSATTACVAAGIIISRQSGSSWLRTDSKMYIDGDVAEAFATTAYVEEVLATFASNDTKNDSDWYLDQADGGEGSGGQSGSVTTQYVEAATKQTTDAEPVTVNNVAVVKSPLPTCQNIGAILANQDDKVFLLNGKVLSTGAYTTSKFSGLIEFVQSRDIDALLRAGYTVIS